MINIMTELFSLIPSGSYAQQYIQLNKCNEFSNKYRRKFVLSKEIIEKEVNPDLLELYSKFETIDNLDNFCKINIDVINKKDHERFQKFQPSEVIWSQLQENKNIKLDNRNYIIDCQFLSTTYFGSFDDVKDNENEQITHSSSAPPTNPAPASISISSNSKDKKRNIKSQPIQVNSCCVFVDTIHHTSNYYKKAVEKFTPNIKYTMIGDKKECQKLIKHLKFQNKTINIIKNTLTKSNLQNIVDNYNMFIIDDSPDAYYCINKASEIKKIKVIRPNSMWNNEIRQQELPININQFEICHAITTKRLILFPFCYEQIQHQTLKPKHIFVTVDKKNVKDEEIINFKRFCEDKPEIIYEIKNIQILSDLRNSNANLIKRFYKVNSETNTNDYLPSKDNNKIIICAQDDDDYYPQESTKCRCIPIIDGFTELTGQENGIYYNIGDHYKPSEVLTGGDDDYSIKTNSILTIYFQQFMTTNNFITYTMDYLVNHKYPVGKKYAEEGYFLEEHKYTNNMYQIKGYPVCIAVNHGFNTVDKKCVLEKIKRSGRIIELPNNFVLQYIKPKHAEFINTILLNEITEGVTRCNINPFKYDTIKENFRDTWRADLDTVLETYKKNKLEGKQEDSSYFNDLLEKKLEYEKNNTN